MLDSFSILVRSFSVCNAANNAGLPSQHNYRMTPYERQLLLSSEHHRAGAPLADLSDLLNYASPLCSSCPRKWCHNRAGGKEKEL
jgi:hypothetical protein